MKRSITVVALLTASVSVVGTVQSVAAGGAGHRGDGARPDLVVDDPAASCAALAGMEIDAEQIGLPTSGGVVDSATLTAATADEPEFCLVTGHLDPVDPAGLPINFQVNLPSTWARRSMQFGGGGFNGSVVTGLGNVPGTAGANAPATPLQRHYATFGSDAGTDTRATSGFPDGSFGTNAEAFGNYAGDSVKKTRDVAQLLIEHYYGEAPKHQYFAGGSKGGHEGLVAAQRYGDDYDGIISYYPAKQNIWLVYGWDHLLQLQAAGPIDPAAQQLVLDATHDVCDGLDGLEDGVISNRAGCDATFDITTLACPGGGTGPGCLSDEQIATMQGAASTTALPYPEANGGTTTGPFPVFHGGSLLANLGAFNYFNSGVMQYWYGGSYPGFDWIANQDAVQAVDRQYVATDTDIDEFLSGGGKLIMVQGATDMLVAPAATDPYYEALVDRYGGRAKNTIKYYVQPGYGHGANAVNDFNLQYDSLTALDAWVTKGAAPQHQVGYDANSATGRSMPLCEYPGWPQYVDGDPDLASSFTCVEGMG